MTTHKKIDINGTEFTEIVGGNVTKAQGDNNSSSSFKLELTNYSGKNAGEVVEGDEVEIFLEKDVFPPTTKIFTGIIETINYRGDKNRETITVQGRDYTSVLQNVTIPPEVYVNEEYSVAIKDFMSKYVPGITTNNVQTTGITFDRKQIIHKSPFDVLRDWAREINYYFFVDVDKDLHFVPKNSESSGITADSTNILEANIKESITTVRNEIWFYGGNYKVAAPTKIFSPDGGSVFDLDFPPFNTNVSYLGSIRQGNVAELNLTPPSGTDYTVDFDNAQIIFVSGTDAGDNIPTSGTGSVVINYDRNRPVVKFAEDTASQVITKGPVSEVLTDDSVKDPNLGTDIVRAALKNNKDPKLEGSIALKDIVVAEPGTTIVVDLSTHNVNNETFAILETNYSLDPDDLLADEVIMLKLNERLKDITDIMKEILLATRGVQTQNIDTTSVVTRNQFDTGSMGFRVKSWKVSTRDIGSSFALGNPDNGVLGSVNGIAAPGSVAHYLLNGDATDEFGNYDGVETNVGYVAGKIGQAGSFNGVNSEITANNILNGISNDFSMAFWFKAGSDQIFKRMIELGSGNDNRALIYLDGTTGNKLSSLVEMGAPSSLNDGTTVVTDGSWHHVVFNWDDTTKKHDVFLDNNIEISGAAGAGTPGSITFNQLTIGFGNSSYVKALIDDVRVYSQKLDSTHRSFLWNSGSGTGSEITSVGAGLQPVLGSGTATTFTVQASGGEI